MYGQCEAVGPYIPQKKARKAEKNTFVGFALQQVLQDAGSLLIYPSKACTCLNSQSGTVHCVSDMNLRGPQEFPKSRMLLKTGPGGLP